MGKALADSCDKGEGWAVPSEKVRGVCVLSLRVGKQRVRVGGMSGGRRGRPRLETREIPVASDKGLFKSGNTN